MPPKMFGHRCHPHMLSSHRGKFITFLRAQLTVFHPPTLSHWQLESKWPPEKQDAQVVDIQRNVPVLFLESLPLARRGWSANNSPEPTPITLSVPHSRLTVLAAWLSLVR
jgi:hypothetical protein